MPPKVEERDEVRIVLLRADFSGTADSRDDFFLLNDVVELRLPRTLAASASNLFARCFSAYSFARFRADDLEADAPPESIPTTTTMKLAQAATTRRVKVIKVSLSLRHPLIVLGRFGTSSETNRVCN